jgi:hypothetical protein
VSSVGGTAARVVRRRSTGPNGRAALGALLVAAAVVGVFAAHERTDGGPVGQAVAATVAVPVGGRLTADDLTLVAVDLPGGSAGRSFEALDELVGAVTVAPLAPGELVQRSAVLSADTDTNTDINADLDGHDDPPGAAPGPARDLSLAVPRDRALGGALQAGERVDVLATYGTGPDAYTAVVARSALVRSVDDATAPGLASAGTVALTLGLATADEVLRVAHAREVAAVALVRATRAPTGDRGPDTYRATPPR